MHAISPRKVFLSHAISSYSSPSHYQFSEIFGDPILSLITRKCPSNYYYKLVNFINDRNVLFKSKLSICHLYKPYIWCTFLGYVLISLVVPCITVVWKKILNDRTWCDVMWREKLIKLLLLVELCIKTIKPNWWTTSNWTKNNRTIWIGYLMVHFFCREEVWLVT